MDTNIRKSLVNLLVLWLVTTIIIPQSWLNGNIEIIYDRYEVSDYEIDVYEYGERPKYQIKVWKPCSRKCPNEVISEGYSEPDPQDRWKDEESSYDYGLNQVGIPMTVDPVLLHILQQKWNNSNYSY